MVDMPKIVTLFSFKSHKSILCGERHEAANMEIRGYIYIYILPQWNSHRSGDSTVYTLNLSKTIPVKWPNLKWLRPTSIKNSSMDMNFHYNTSIIQLCLLVESPFLMFKSCRIQILLIFLVVYILITTIIKPLQYMTSIQPLYSHHTAILEPLYNHDTIVT